MSEKKETEHPFEQQPAIQTPPRRRFRILRWVFLACLILVFLLPQIIGSTSLKDSVIKYALGDYKGDVTVDKLSLGWFSPVQVSGVTIYHTDEQPLARIESLKTSKPLVRFLWDRTNLGEVEIHNPEVNIVLQSDGSNLETALNDLMGLDSSATPNDSVTNSPAAQPLPKLVLKCINGVANVDSIATGESWTLDSLNVLVSTSTNDIPLTAEGECRFVVDNNPMGGVAFSGQVDQGSKLLTFRSAQLAMTSQNFPLGLAAPVVQRFIGPTTTIGHLSSELQLAYDASSPEIAVNIGQFELIGAGIAAPNLIGEDKIYAESLTAHGQLNIAPHGIDAKNFQLKSDLGSLTANGVFDPQQLNKLVADGELLNTPFSMNGRIDLAGLAQMLPNTLQLYDDLQIQSGMVSFQAASSQQTADSPRRIVLNVDTANIKARRGMRDIVWQKPLRLVSNIEQVDGKLAVENLKLVSDFLTLEGKGALQSANFKANGDLAILVNRIEQFADLGGLQLQGTLQGNFGWKVADGQQANFQTLQGQPIQLGGRFDILNPSVKWPELPLWKPEQLSLQVHGKGTSLFDHIELENGGFSVQVGSEQFIADLSQPIANIWNQSSWQMNCQMTGELANWMRHIKNFVDIGPIQGGGALAMACVATVNSQKVVLENVRYQVAPFGFEGYGVSIVEPKLEGTGRIDYSVPDYRLTFNGLSAKGTTFNVETNEFVVQSSDQLLMNGRLNFQSDLSAASKWLGISTRPDDIYWFGKVDGNVTFDATQMTPDSGFAGTVEANVTELLAAQQATTNAQAGPGAQFASNRKEWTELWKEPNVGLTSQIRFGADYDSIQIQNLNVNATSGTLNARGNLGQLSSSLVTDLSGKWRPNLQMINQLVTESVGPNVARFNISEPQEFIVKGPLFATSTNPSNAWFPPELYVSTSVSWRESEFLKIPFGPNRMLLDLRQSVANLNLEPIPFEGGMLYAAPQLDMRQSEPWLTLPQGMVADQVKLTAETCRSLLKYVAPLAADATSARGKVSVSNEVLRMPIMNPTAAQAQGIIRLQDVTIGAGPLADQLLGTANQLKSLLKPGRSGVGNTNATWLRMDDQDIPIAYQNGRVYHDGITFSYDDVRVRTKGSVGIDQTINLVAEIPIQDAWVEGDRWLAGMKGQMISIPITGTVTKPRFDKQALQQISRQMLQRTAGSAINNAIEKELGGKPQRIINDRLNSEINKAQDKLNNKFQEEVGSKLEGELLNGLNNLFKKKGGGE